MTKRRTTKEPLENADATSSEHRPRAVMETRVFKSGNSYAVRLPVALYSGGEAPVSVRRLEDGRILISPVRKRRWPKGFFDTFEALPVDFEAPERPSPRVAEERRAAALFRSPRSR
jgi:virulence-associated protein VagC